MCCAEDILGQALQTCNAVSRLLKICSGVELENQQCLVDSVGELLEVGFYGSEASIGWFFLYSNLVCTNLCVLRSCTAVSQPWRYVLMGQGWIGTKPMQAALINSTA